MDELDLVAPGGAGIVEVVLASLLYITFDLLLPVLGFLTEAVLLTPGKTGDDDFGAEPDDNNGDAV